jgi:hypothetical protein
MTKKLNVSDFLRDFSSTKEEGPFLNIRKESNFTISLTEFYTKITEHTFIFCVNGTEYTSLIPSKNNLYFFNEASNDEFILIFDPIIDIKQRNGAFNIFYYPDKVITIALKESNVKEPQQDPQFKSL